MNFYFLTVDIGLKYAGVEASSILRSELFCNQLNIYPSFITSKYRPFHDKVFSDLKINSKINKKIENINVYDILQDIDRSSLAVKADGLIDSEEKAILVPGYLDKKVFDPDGKLKKYLVFHKRYDLLHYINFFKDRKKWRREYYDSLGFLSSSQFLHDDKAYLEIYYRSNRSIALIKSYNYVNGKLKGVEIQILNSHNQLVEVVSNERELSLYALNVYFKNKNEDFTLVVDRNRFYYPIALEIKKRFSSLNLRVFVIPVIHNMHSIVNSKTGKSHINVNYLDIFKESSSSDVVLTQTKLQENEINKDYSYVNAVSIPHSYENNINLSKSYELDNFKAVYLARYSPEKKHELAIHAFSKVIDVIPNATFYCYGFGTALASLKELVVSLGLNKNIFLCGWVDDISKEYLTAGLSLISSQSESFSLTILESLSHGCPVVAFDVPYGPRELIINGENGYLVPYPDVDAMASRVIEVMQNKSLQLKLSEQAILTSKKYTEKNVAERWRDLFYSLGITINNAPDVINKYLSD